ncbi:polysaccharide pyruvyl transferase family protein [Alkalibacterium sp. f15]|uniref:polysaccharide pyruvyl transferase family protein n=1 Tax=Alkalibacterium sp. f15 TaxID=3414029 RepID=UPI003BF8F071
MKKMLIKAFTKINLGDDLFIKILCERYPDVQFFIECSEEEAKPFEKITNLKAFQPFLIERIIKKVNRTFSIEIPEFISKRKKIIDSSLGTVNIGGSIFIQDDNWKSKVKNYNEMVLSSRNYYIIGSNFGPFQDKDYLTSYTEVFKQVNDVCFREKYSYDLFSENNNVRYAPDVVFTMDTKNDLSIKNTDDEKYIVISIIDLSNRAALKMQEDHYINAVYNIIVDAQARNYKVSLMSFCEYEGDLIAINKIKNYFEEKGSSLSGVSSYNYNGNMVEALSIIENSSGVVATRFHSVILGLLFNKPLYPFIYSSKTLNVLNDIGFKGKYTHINEIEQLDTASVVSQLEDYSAIDISKQCTEAENQFYKLDQLLN